MRWSLYARRLNRPPPPLLPRSTIDWNPILATAETHPETPPHHKVVQHNIHSFLLSFTVYTLSLQYLPTARSYHSLAPSSLRIYLSEIVSTSFLAIACYLTLILGAAATSSCIRSLGPWMRDAFLVLFFRGGMRSVFVGAAW